MPDRTLEDLKFDRSVFKNPDAVSYKLLMQFAKMRSSVLKSASEKTLLQDITVNNPLPVDHGLEGKFYDWGELVAVKKPEGATTGVQRPVPGTTKYVLEQSEVPVGITDEATINSQLKAQNLLTAGQSGKAFARAMDSDVLNEFVNESNSTAGTNWDTETDVNIRKQLREAGDEVEDVGFDVSTILMTSGQLERIGRIESIVKGFNTVEKYMLDIFPGATLKKWRKIRYKDDHLVWQTLFDPVGKLILLDKAGFAVFTQRPTTMEFYRDVPAGVDYAYMRKFFGSKVVQKDAGHMLTGLTL